MTTKNIDEFDIRLYKFERFTDSLDCENWYDWTRACGKAVREWNGTDEGIPPFDNWSSPASNYEGREDCATLYRSLALKNNGSSNRKKNKATNALLPLTTEQFNAATSSREYCESLGNADINHYQLALHKSLNHEGLLQDNQTLVIPIQNVHGNHISHQTIDIYSEKAFFPFAKMAGGFHIIGSLTNDTLIFCESYFDGSALYQATKLPIVVTFAAFNLPIVATIFRKKLPRHKFYIAADDDYTASDLPNTGIEAALEAAENSRANILYPRSLDEVRRKQDFSDVLTRDGMDWLLESLKEQLL